MAQEDNSALDKIQERGTLIWGADAEGGAPYIFPDPENPEEYIGFEVDLANAIANKLGVTAVHKQNGWDGLVPALERGDFDIAMNGIEITDERKDTILFSRPYYIYTEQLVVRKDDNSIKGINDLKGKKVGTLSGTVAQDILENLDGVDVRIYPTQVEPYTDLAFGRIDAVLLDLPIAAFYGKPNPELKYAGDPVGEGLYGIAIRQEDEELKAKIDEILAELLRSGELKQIYEKWGLWNEAQDKLYEQMKEETGYTNANLEKSQQAPISTNIIMVQENNSALDKIQERGTLIWGADAEGGAPYIFPDPENPEEYIGFEVDLANAIANKLGVTAVHKQNGWDGLVPALERGDFDIAMNGIEITDERKETILFSRPYYIYTEQLVVRKDDNSIKGINDLKGKKVGTLSGTVAQDILENLDGVDVRIYPTQVEPYTDLAFGRIDAVLLDLPIAAFYGKPNPELKYAGDPVGEGLYGIAIRQEDEELKAKIDEILAELLRSGELKQIYEKWGLWNEAQDKLYEEMQGENGYTNANLEKSQQAPISTFFPALLKGAALTIVISVVSMTLAVTLGLFISLIRLYGRAPFTSLATAYIEIYRGTPLLIQLYLLYYGLPNIGISLSPWLAAFIGLGMNYAAYEAEIYRAGISAIPKGQMEAALSLGMSRKLAIKRIILPQALRISLPGITNDFIALFKDSSLVSIIAMVELTKTYNILASSTLRYFELGLITALLYFGMSYPLSLLARRLENRLKGKKGVI